MTEERLPIIALLLTLAFSCIRTPAHGQSKSVTLNAVGDILFARGLERKIDANGEEYPFRAISPLLRHAGVVFGNLETTLSDRPFATNQQFRFRALPARAKLLRLAGFTMVNLANNHSLDCGPEGLRDTLRAVSAEGIQTCGAGTKGSGATIIEQSGVKIVFVAFSDFPPVVRDDSPLSIHYASEEAVDRAVRDARQQADVVIVSFHWGQEQSATPTARQKRLARVAAGAGADLILGHHPHVLQGFELLRNGGRRTLVAYSLGNFLFDGHKDAEKQSIILQCRLDRSGLLSAEILPVQIVHSAPQPAKGQERTAILGRISALSRQLGSKVEGAKVIIPAL